MRRTKIVATIGPACRDPETLTRMVEAGHGRRAAQLLARQPRDPRRERRARARRRRRAAGRQVAILQDLPGPKIRIGALEDDIAELKPGEKLVLLCGIDERRQRASGCRSAGPAWPSAVDPDDVIYLADGAIRLRVDARPRGRRRGRDRGRDRRLGRLAPGPQHPGLDARAARGARGGPRHAPLRRVDRRRPGRAVVRAHRRGRDQRAPAHAAAADREDREAAGGRRRRGDHPRRRLRDGRPRRPRDRAPDRGRPDRPEAAAADRRPARAALDHRHADARLDGRLLAPDPRRGRRRRQRDPRRHRRGDALPGDGDRLLPGRGGRDDGLDRRADRARAAVPRPGTRSASGATRATRRTRSPTAPAPPRATCTSRRWSCRRCRAARRG